LNADVTSGLEKSLDKGQVSGGRGQVQRGLALGIEDGRGTVLE
jgi:hypothetical protein